MRKVLMIAAGVVLGFVAGVIGMVAHAGPIDMPIIGLVVATLLVASGAWFVYELGRGWSWIPYVLTVLAVTYWLTYAPPANDILLSVTGWASETWLVLSVVGSILPALVASIFERRRRRGSQF